MAQNCITGPPALQRGFCVPMTISSRSPVKLSSMAVYMADCHMPRATLEQLLADQKAAIETSRRFTAGGRPVRFIRTAWVPGDGRVMCLFEAENPQSVRDVNEAAGIPFTRIVEAIDLSPP
jgi:hypothetical protein